MVLPLMATQASCVNKMCPYARFQSAMFDRNTLIISYDPQRGEPRGPRKRTLDHRAAGLGDCVDCTLCVQVCPTGIDIRNGLQYQCIGCAACIDACDNVMEKLGYPKGFIRYTTQNAVTGKPTHILRPRIVVYALLLVGITGAVLYGLIHRVPLDLDVIRDRNALYRQTEEGMVENVYTLKVINMDRQAHSYQLFVDGILGMELIRSAQPIKVGAGEVLSLPVLVRVDPFALEHGSTAITFTLQADNVPHIRVMEEARFLGPGPRA